MSRIVRTVSLVLGSVFLTLSSRSQQADRFAYAITDINKGGANWSFLRKLDLQTGEFTDVLLAGNDASKLGFDALTKKQLTAPVTDARFGANANAPFNSGVAAATFDSRHNRLYYTPMFIDQLRYIDLGTMNVYYYTQASLLDNGPKASDQSNIITRMAIDEDGIGYALTNNAQHLIRFSTDKKSTVTDLGAVVDAPVNTAASILNSCTSFGGDMVADNDGNLIVLSARNHVFQINIASRVATHLGTISGLPTNFTINGAAVNEDNRIVVTSAVDATSIYVVDSKTWTASPLATSASLWQTADLANSNVLQTRVSVGVPELITAKAATRSLIQIYPNPVTNNNFTIVFGQAKAGNYLVQVTDARGVNVAQQRVTVGSKGQSVSGINLPAPAAKGIYIVKVSDTNREIVYSNKIVVQ